MRVTTLHSRPVGSYSYWEGVSDNGSLVCIYLANNVLHMTIYKGSNPEGISIRKPVECPGNSMLMEEMMRQLDIELIN